MKIAIGADHRGHPYKTRFIEKLGGLGHEMIDCGCDSTDSADYPLHAIAAAEKVASGEAERGILICGSGIGVSIAANKVRGIRASMCMTVGAARTTVQHNDSNIICMSGDATPWETAEAMVDAWLAAEFEGGRHGRRVDQIVAYENGRDRTKG